MVVGVAGRLLPLYGWLLGFAARRYEETPPSLHRAPARPLQAVVLGLWTLGVPALAAGFAADRTTLIAGAAAALAVAVVLQGANLVVVLVRLWRRGPVGVEG